MFVEEKRQGEVVVVEPTPDQKIIDDAIELLQRDGWCQLAYRHWYTVKGCALRIDGRCAQGALMDAAKDDGWWGPLSVRIDEILLGKVGKTLVDWNDDVAKSKDEVIAMLQELKQHV